MCKFIFLIFIGFAPYSNADSIASFATLAAMHDLNIQSDSVPTIVAKKQTQTSRSELWNISLGYKDLPSFSINLNGPKGFMTRKKSYRVLFMVVGFSSSNETANLFGEIDDTVLVTFNYPATYKDIVKDPKQILQLFRFTPGMIALSLKWIFIQAWVNQNRLVTTGVSLGGLFLPSALHMSQELQVNVSRTVFAFTGSDLNTILVNNLKGHLPDDVVNAIAISVPAINTLSDPRLHLPELKGSFLVIYGDQDTVIPTSATEELFNLLPSKKEKVLLHGGHINVDQGSLIQQTKTSILEWTEKN